MPTSDEHAPLSRATRRPLGRGPGTAPSRTGGPEDDRDTVPVPVPEPVAEPEPRPQPAEPEPKPRPEPEAEPEREPPLVTEPASEPASEDEGEAGAGEGDGEPDDRAADGRFTVVLDNFEGPFDLLLQLISRHKMDVTEVSLSRVTDDFLAHIRAMGPDGDLDATTEFLVVAATLLDLKAARLLPSAQIEDEADLALLEARDLLFARLLQYRAYKEVAGVLAGRFAAEGRRYPRTVGLEPHHAELLPEVVLRIGPEGLARLAVKATQPRPEPRVYVDHIHAPLVSVREQAAVVVARLRELGEASFGTLTEDAADTLTVVARFLALLELYRERVVTLDQEEALGTLMVRWSGEADAQPRVTDEFDREPAGAGEGARGGTAPEAAARTEEQA